MPDETNNTPESQLQRLVDPNQRYKPAARTAFIEFVRSKPWRGDPLERRDKFSELHRKLCAVYEVPHMLVYEEIDPLQASRFGIDDQGRRLILTGKPSVLTYLIAFGQCRGFAPRETYTWAVTTFARFFPRSFAKCEVREGRIVQRAQ